MRASLLAWFAASGRDLPWREPHARRDPYRVLVAEVMLQQTRVATAVPYYHRWLERFPDLRTLAEADEDAVLRAWQGLGYYRRALNLQRAARLALERFGGELPSARGDLETLPGIGRYTAAAVAALAFGRPAVAVDANVRRVAARVHGWEDPPADPEVERALLATFGPPTPDGGQADPPDGAAGAARRPPAARAGTDTHERDAPATPGGEAAALAEALIELGALVCTPRGPACGRCPLAPGCLAAAEGAPERYPRRRARRPPPLRRRYALVALEDGRVWLARRVPGALLGGLWGFPQVTDPPQEGHRLEPVLHAYSHFRLELTPVLVPCDHPALTAQPTPSPQPLADLGRLALSGVDLRVLARLSEEGVLPRAASPAPWES